MNIASVNIFAQLPTYIFWKDLHSRFLGCNDHFAKAAGLFSRDEIKGKTDFDLPWRETHAELYQQGDREVLEGKLIQSMIEPQLQANGKTTRIIISKTPLRDEFGQKIGVIGTYMEASQPKYHGIVDPNKKNISLTSKQIDCLAYLAKGMTAKQIASELELSIRTVESNIQTLKLKMDSPTKAALTQKAWSIDFIRARILELT